MSTPKPESARNPKRILIAVLGVIACCLSGWYCVRTGLARTLARVATVADNPAVADRAVWMSTADAETHSSRGEVLEHSGNYPEAASEFERAVQLRPRDYYLWLELGLARDSSGDQEGALRAFRQATALAPAYANTRWQLGNNLLRMGRGDEAFIELRRAGMSNPALLPSVIDLAWGVYKGDPTAVEAAVAPRSDFDRVALAIVFARHGSNASAATQFLLSSGEAKQQGETLLGLLLQSKAFNEAHQVWAKLHGLSTRADDVGSLYDGGFETPLLLGDPGFGWQVTPGLPNVLMSVDEATHQSGTKSLRIEFRGNSEPQTAFLSQLVLIRAQTNYRLVFSARAQQIVSAALPIITVSDASERPNRVLGQSSALRSDSEDWREFAIDFTTGPQTGAVIISVVRQGCPDTPCPAFGTLWLDSLSIRPTQQADAGSRAKKIDAFGRS